MTMDMRPVLRRIKPSAREEADMRRFGETLLSISSMSGAKPMLCGSVEKGTWLSEKNEIDLFLLFDTSVPKKQLEVDGLAMARKIINAVGGTYVIAYAEHPYLRGKVGKRDVDIVPCYDVKDADKIISAVDRTPHHVKFVKANLKNPDDVRLLKQFCRSNGCYGADLKTLGFSGYICELLIIKYGSFPSLIADASKWRAGHAVSFGAETRGFRSPLVVVDPVDRSRNVGAAVSAESFYKFVRACREFVKKPSMGLFFKKGPKPCTSGEIARTIKSRGTCWHVIKFRSPDVLEDILYPQLRKCVSSIEKILGQGGFRVLRSGFLCDGSCTLVFEMEICQIPTIFKNVGPDIYSRHADQFLSHYKDKGVFIEGENWVVEASREFTSSKDLLSSFLKLSVKDLLGKGVPSKIAPVIKGRKLLSISEAAKSKEFRAYLREWFNKDLNVM
jgi:tRNA nucleotidyltransferase (CCA-adding enzyme)